MQEVECGNESEHASVDKQHENDDETRAIESETEEVDKAPEAGDETTTLDLLMEEKSHKVFVQNDIGCLEFDERGCPTITNAWSTR